MEASRAERVGLARAGRRRTSVYPYASVGVAAVFFSAISIYRHDRFATGGARAARRSRTRSRVLRWQVRGSRTARRKGRRPWLFWSMLALGCLAKCALATPPEPCAGSRGNAGALAGLGGAAATQFRRSEVAVAPSRRKGGGPGRGRQPAANSSYSPGRPKHARDFPRARTPTPCGSG